jgi:hypothetical protein
LQKTVRVVNPIFVSGETDLKKFVVGKASNVIGRTRLRQPAFAFAKQIEAVNEYAEKSIADS